VREFVSVVLLTGKIFWDITVCRYIIPDVSENRNDINVRVKGLLDPESEGKIILRNVGTKAYVHNDIAQYSRRLDLQSRIRMLFFFCVERGRWGLEVSFWFCAETNYRRIPYRLRYSGLLSQGTRANLLHRNARTVSFM